MPAATLTDFDKAFQVLFCYVLAVVSARLQVYLICSTCLRWEEVFILVHSMEQVCKLTGTQPSPGLVPQLLAHTSCLLAAAGNMRQKGQPFGCRLFVRTGSFFVVVSVLYNFKLPGLSCLTFFEFPWGAEVRSWDEQASPMAAQAQKSGAGGLPRGFDSS